MRHVRSILYALVLAPAVWVLAGVGLTGDLATRGRDEFAVETYTGLLMLLLAGAAYAILVFAPISPAGPTTAGVVFLGATLWALNAPGGYADAWPAGVSKESFDLSRPGYGVAALLAVPLLCTALSVRRWQRYEPPVLPIIGQIGRARGAARVAGTPMAADETTVIGPGTPNPATEPAKEPATVIGFAGGESESDRTIMFPTGEHEATILLPHEPRTVAIGSPAEEKEEEPATVPLPEAAGEPVTENVERTRDLALGDIDRTSAIVVGKVVEDEDEATRPILLTENVEQTRDLAQADPDRTSAIVLPTDKDEDEDEEDDGHDDEPTRPVLFAGNADRTRDLTHADPDRTAAVAIATGDDDGEKTRNLALGDPDKTGVVRHDEQTQDFDPDRTQYLTFASSDPDAVQPIRFPDSDGAGPVAPVSGPGEGIRRLRVDAETPRTTVEPPDERTEVFRVPSIADAEAPNFAEDPTGRIVPPGASPDQDERTTTVTSMERPEDETSAIPAQRRPPAED